MFVEGSGEDGDDEGSGESGSDHGVVFDVFEVGACVEDERFWLAECCVTVADV